MLAIFLFVPALAGAQLIFKLASAPAVRDAVAKHVNGRAFGLGGMLNAATTRATATADAAAEPDHMFDAQLMNFAKFKARVKQDPLTLEAFFLEAEQRTAIIEALKAELDDARKLTTDLAEGRNALANEPVLLRDHQHDRRPSPAQQQPRMSFLAM